MIYDTYIIVKTSMYRKASKVESRMSGHVLMWHNTRDCRTSVRACELFRGPVDRDSQAAVFRNPENLCGFKSFFLATHLFCYLAQDTGEPFPLAQLPQSRPTSRC